MSRLLLEKTFPLMSAHFSDEIKLIHHQEVVLFYENFLYALALFKRKEAETILKGKQLLLRLCRYQMESGAFPSMLHLYNDPFQSFSLNLLLLVPFYLILEEFSKVIDKESKETLQTAYSRLYQFVKAAKFSKIETLLLSILEGKKLEIESFNLESQKECALYATILFLLYKQNRLEAIFFEPFIIHFLEENSEYSSNPSDLAYFRGEPKLSLAELFCHDAKAILPDLSRLHRTLLFESALVESLPMPPLKGAPYWEKGAFRHFIALPTNGTLIGEERTFRLEGDAKEDEHEIVFYLSRKAVQRIKIGEKTSSVFREGETLTIETITESIHLSFHLIEGSGQFIGHVSLDSRPKEEEVGNLYDYKISLRTLERTSTVVIRFHIESTTHDR